MTAPSTNHGLSMPPALKGKLEELAYQERKPVSVIMRDIVTTYAEQGLGAFVLGVPGIHRALGVKVNFLVADDVWAAAQERAERDTITLSDLARRVLIARTKDLSMPKITMA